MTLNPIDLTHVFKDYIWGGDKLVKEYNKKVICLKLQKVGNCQFTKMEKVLLQKENFVD